MSDYEISQLRRRLANIIRIGVVCEVDYALAVARVSIGELTTDWLPWIMRAGEDKVWHGVDIGEQVLVLAPCGDLSQAVILPSLHKQPPVCQGNLHSFSFKDGSNITFDRDTGNLTANITGNADITCKALSANCQTSATIKAPQITLDGNVTITGDLSTNGTVLLSGGGAGIARVGDAVVVNPITHQGTITAGSGKVMSG